MAKKKTDNGTENGNGGDRTPMSDAHKAALAEGREQGRAVRRYLEALEAHQPKRGRKRDLSNVEARIAAIDEKLASADALTRLHLTQERMDLEAALTVEDDSDTLADAEDAFIQAAAGYGTRKGIIYSTWRQIGVPADVLRRAGIARSG